MKYSFDPDSPIIVVEVELKGKRVTERIKTALDTGATYTMISWNLLEFREIPSIHGTSSV